MYLRNFKKDTHLFHPIIFTKKILIIEKQGHYIYTISGLMIHAQSAHLLSLLHYFTLHSLLYRLHPSLVHELGLHLPGFAFDNRNISNVDPARWFIVVRIVLPPCQIIT